MAAAATRISHLGLRRQGQVPARRAALNRAWSFLLGCACPLLALPAWSAPADDTALTAAAPATIELVVIGQPAQLQALQSSLGQVARGSSVQWFLTPRLTRREVLRVPEPGTKARCFIDLSKPPRVRLYFADAAAQRFLIREVSLNDGLNEMGRETLAQIIESSLDALLEQSAEALTREQLSRELAQREPPAVPPRVEPPRPPPPTPALERYRLDWQLFYALESFAATPGLAHGPGLGASFGTAKSPRFSAWSSVQYQLPQNFQERSIGLRLQGVPLRAGPGVELTPLPALGLGARLGVGVDLVHLSPRQGTTGSASLSEARWTAVSIATAMLDLKLRLSTHTAVCLSPFVDLDIEPRHYDLTVNGQRRAVLEPAAFRVGVSLAAVSAF